MKTGRVLMLSALAATSACHKDSGTPPPPAPTPHISVPVAVKKGPSAAQLTAGMVEAASQGNAQLPVQLKFDLKQRPTPGQALDIDLALIPQIDAGAAAIQLAGGDGLTVAPGTTQIDLPAVESGQVYRRSVKVTPTADGVLLLNLTITLKHDEMIESRAFSIPLIVER
ncbi:MAG TPA: hypothetical protein VGN30_00575 [Steroidobacteraceae bacterium]|jgi:hypothetical protein